MPVQKRKRPHDSDDSDHQLSDDAGSDDDVDISSALTGQKSKKKPHVDPQEFKEAEEDDDEIEEVIKESIAKRNVKSGTELLKKTKGKSKIVKGEVGGGSFQSMGASHSSLNFSLHLISEA